MDYMGIRKKHWPLPKSLELQLRRHILSKWAAGCPVNQELQTLDHYLVKRSQWIIGGDGGYPPRDTL